MFSRCRDRLKRLVGRCVQAGQRRLSRWPRPSSPVLVADILRDMVRSRTELILENALLRQQPIILGRTAQRPRFTPSDHRLLVLLASRLRAWANVLLLVQPATVLRWHRDGFRLVWRRKSRRRASAPRLPAASLA